MIYIFLLAIAWLIFERIRKPKHLLKLDVYFGVPGSGKTTYAAYLAKKANYESIVIRLCKRFPCRFTDWIVNGDSWKRCLPVYSNVPIKNTLQLDVRNDIGRVMIDNGKMIIDEAGIEFNNRNYKALPHEAIKFFKYHRHYQVSIDVFSQSFDDMDITLRRLAQTFYVVKKSLIPFFIVTKRINRKIGIDDKTHQMADLYRFGLPVIDTRWTFCPPLWKMFDSYSFDPLPPKNWTYWDSSSIDS